MTSIFIRDTFASMLVPAFWIIVIYLGVFFVIRRISLRDEEVASEQGREDSMAALRILKERYAKGDIKTEEFEKTRNGLLGKRAKKTRKREEDNNPTKKKWLAP